MDVKTAFNRMKTQPDTEIHFFFCEAGADNKPILLVNTMKIDNNDIDAALKGAKKKTSKCIGKLNMPAANVLNADPVGSFPPALAKGLKKVAATINVKLAKITIKGEEQQVNDTDDDDQNENETEQETGSANEGKAFQDRLKGFLPKYTQALPTHPQASTLKGLYEKVKAAMEAQNWGQANQILDTLQSALAKGGQVPPPPPIKKTAPSSPPSANEIAFRKLWANAKSAWRTASDNVDAQITQLQGALRASEDAELHDIAETGLNSVTGDYKVPLMAVLMDVDHATGPKLKTSADKAKNIVTAFKKYLESEPTVAACDQNPFGVTVTIRKSLSGALDQIDKILAAAPKQ